MLQHKSRDVGGPGQRHAAVGPGGVEARQRWSRRPCELNVPDHKSLQHGRVEAKGARGYPAAREYGMAIGDQIADQDGGHKFANHP